MNIEDAINYLYGAPLLGGFVALWNNISLLTFVPILCFLTCYLINLLVFRNKASLFFPLFVSSMIFAAPSAITVASIADVLNKRVFGDPQYYISNLRNQGTHLLCHACSNNTYINVIPVNKDISHPLDEFFSNPFTIQKVVCNTEHPYYHRSCRAFLKSDDTIISVDLEEFLHTYDKRTPFPLDSKPSDFMEQFKKKEQEEQRLLYEEDEVD